mgnify:CR=1 FL=1
MSSILFLNCAAKKPLPQVAPDQTQNIQQLEEELKNINSELSSEDNMKRINGEHVRIRLEDEGTHSNNQDAAKLFVEPPRTTKP